MGQLRSAVRAFALGDRPPDEVMASTNHLLIDLDPGLFASCCYIRLDPATGLARAARAGHPPPLLRLAGGDVQALDGGLSTPIGLDSSGRPEATVDVPLGATLVLYTDGLVERRDRGLRDGIAALTAELSGVPDDADARAVRDRLVETFIGAQQEDDVCLLVVGRALPTR